MTICYTIRLNNINIYLAKLFYSVKKFRNSYFEKIFLTS